MAVVRIPQGARLQMKVQTGINNSGAPVFRVRSLQNLKNNAIDADIYSVAQGLSGLQKHALIGVSRQDDISLVQE